MNVWGFVCAAVLLTLMPGPDILFVLTQSIIRGKKAGIVFALGLCSGLVFHVAAVSLGVSLLLKESPVAFMALKVAGAAYLVYSGIKAFRGRSREVARWEVSGTAIRKLYRKGIVMNLLNPKVILFFLAFFPQFVSAEAGNPAGQMVFLGLLFIAQAVLIFSLTAFLADKLSASLMRRPRVAYGMSVMEAVIYCTIGISILFV